MKIRINDTWFLVGIVRSRKPDAVCLAFSRQGHPPVQRVIEASDTSLLIKIFTENAVMAVQHHLAAYTNLRILGLAKPLPDQSGRMLLTPAGRQVAIWIRSRGNMPRATRKEAHSVRHG